MNLSECDLSPIHVRNMQFRCDTCGKYVKPIGCPYCVIRVIRPAVDLRAIIRDHDLYGNSFIKVNHGIQ